MPTSKNTMRNRTYKLKTRKSYNIPRVKIHSTQKKFEEFEEFVEFEFEHMYSGEKTEPDWKRMETLRNDVYKQMELVKNKKFPKSVRRTISTSNVSLASRYTRMKKKFEEFDDFVEFEFETMCSGEKTEPDWTRLDTLRKDVFHQIELMYSIEKEK